jgi:predicted dehydrogenase
MSMTRRQFLTRAAAAATVTIVPRHVLGGPGQTPPSETITRGVVGTGSQGMGHVAGNKKGAPPVTLAVCDVDKAHLARALQKAGEGCKGYTDFREVLDRKDIDVVHVPTPPHWHALVSIAAAQAGKDVFSEKPTTRFIREGRVLVETMQRYGRVYASNTWGRNETHRKLRKLIASGFLGAPLTVRMTRSRGCNFKIRQWSGSTALEPQPVPDVLDYNLWLGPAPVKPYNPARVHQKFRGYWDYDGGGLTDMGQHYWDPIQYALGKEYVGPVEVEAYAPWPPDEDAVGLWGRCTLKYADGTTVIFESGEWGEQEAEPHAFIEGPKGKVLHMGRLDTDPPGLADRLGAFPDPPPLVDFYSAVRTRGKPTAKPDVEAAHRGCSVVNLCNMAIRVGRKIRWDPEKEQVIGDEEANRLVNVPMRAPWHL